MPISITPIPTLIAHIYDCTISATGGIQQMGHLTFPEFRIISY